MRGLKTDNRMGWIRNIETVEADVSNSHMSEQEIGSECHIPGVLSYDDGMILCGGLTLEPDERGLYHYLLRIQNAGLREPFFDPRASRKGYFFKGGTIGEILSIFSIFFRCRFFLLASYSGQLDERGLKIKREHRILHQRCYPQIHPPIFDGTDRNFATGLTEFMNSVRSVPSEYHLQIIQAFYSYSRSLREVGIDSEMVFIRLVSAIEALTKFVDLEEKEDPLSEERFSDFVKEAKLSSEERDELKMIFDNRRAKARFIAFTEQHSKGFFKGGNYRASRLRIRKSNLSKVLSTIYDARSSYLHRGQPMYLSQPMRGDEKWHTDPTVGAIMDKRRFTESEKLPYAHFFEGLVRHCIVNFVTSLAIA